MTNKSAKVRVILLDMIFPKFNYLSLSRGIRLILNPKSHRTCGIFTLPVVHEMVNLPGSFSFAGIVSNIVVSHFSVMFTFSLSNFYFIPVSNGFINLAKLGISSKTS